MTQKTIKISISPIGKPTVEAVGFNGVGCQDATKAIETALAGSDAPVTRVLKTEWYEQEAETNHQPLWG
jgi:hypothetical protein